jgi:hypothetical protein
MCANREDDDEKNKTKPSHTFVASKKIIIITEKNLTNRN